MFKKINFYQLTITAVAVLFASALVVYGWTAPAGSPPGNDVPPPINSGPDAQTKIGGLILGTGVSSTQSALVIPIGNFSIGTSTLKTKGSLGGFINVQDIWLRDAASGAGAWASSLSGGAGGGALDSSKLYTRPGTPDVAGQLDCLSGDSMISGSCVGYDVCNDEDTTNFGGYPRGNGWFCPSFGCTRITTYVRCYTAAATAPVFCSNGTQPGQVTPTTGWSTCDAVLPDVCGGQGCWAGQVYGTAYGTQTRTVQTCQADGTLTSSEESRSCSTSGLYCSDPNYCVGWGGI